MNNPTKDIQEETVIRGIRLGRIAGIGVHLDWSWLVTSLLILWNVSSFVVPQADPGGSITEYLGLGIAASLLFFFSILAHELAHALVARSRGVSVRRITLYIFGGATSLEDEPRTPESEFRIAIAGPLTSLLLRVAYVLIANFGRFPPMEAFFNPQHAAPGMSAVSAVFQWLGPLNILIGLFNLLPGFPLDGGRVLRSVLWARSGDLRIATQSAILAGQILSGALIAAGAAMILGIELPGLGSGTLNGMWVAFIGWFLLTSANNQANPEEKAQESLEGVPVERLMRRNLPSATPAMPLTFLVTERIMKSDEPTFPVIYIDKLVGLVTMEQVQQIPRENWDKVRVAEIMTHREYMAVVSPRTDSMDALHRMARRGLQQITVVEGQRLAGILHYEDIQKWMKARTSGPVPGEGVNPGASQE